MLGRRRVVSMILMILFLAGAGVYVEIKAVTAMPWLGDLLAKYRLACLGFSFALSSVLALFFGAHGLIVFISAMMSTVMIQPYYAMRKSGQLEVLREKKAAAQAFYQENKVLYRKRAHQLLVITIFTWKLVTLPFKIMFKIFDTVDRGVSFFKRKEVVDVA